MKHLLLMAIAAVHGCAITSCETVAADGDWDPIVVNKTEINLPAEGGKDSVCITKNYSRWWIGDLSSNDEHAINEDHKNVSFNGLTAVVPTDRKSWVIVEAEPSQDNKTWELTMQCGDAFRVIKINQK